ncbi:hypothetical protein [Thauera humireducens]|uniref:hypothetical protein n=1 Tax=Thauera humireducens TaxID=1134435 RepID=UPI0031204358
MPLTSVEDRLYVLRTRWEGYTADGSFEHFIEFAVAINSLAEHFNRLRLPGLVRLCEGLENAALAKLGDQSAHPCRSRTSCRCSASSTRCWVRWARRVRRCPCAVPKRRRRP